jgi:hypothetical protein
VPLAAVGDVRAMEGVMPSKNLWNTSVPRVEIDHRVRDARLRLERIERLLVPRAAVTNFWLRRVFCLFRLGLYGNASPGNRTRGPLSNRRPSRMPTIHQVGFGVGLFCRGLGLPPRHPAAA